MKTVEIRNVVIGQGRPKICVPIVGKTTEEIITEAKTFDSIPVDVVEWRVDWFDDVMDTVKVIETAEKLRGALGEIPILFTFRTSKEGGEKSISDADYAALNIAVAESGYVDLVDVEAFSGDELVRQIVEKVHNAGVKVIGSNHHFHETPSKEDIVNRLKKMQELDCDIPKIAVMPQKKEDVLVLLSATLEMSEQYADRPIITMSMSGTGVISRLAGEVFGSALTFGAAKKASAPGQIGVNELEQVLSILHKSI